jgi:hypothetical protein
MPYTMKEVRYLLSSGSPLSMQQQDKMKQELHENPAIGRQRKGTAAMKRGPRKAKK